MLTAILITLSLLRQCEELTKHSVEVEKEKSKPQPFFNQLIILEFFSPCLACKSTSLAGTCHTQESQPQASQSVSGCDPQALGYLFTKFILMREMSLN